MGDRLARFLFMRLVLLFFCSPLAGQYRITRIGSEQGLSESHVYCVLQDSRGFMWFGTRDGLNRYDGYEIKTYYHNPDDPRSLSNSYIYALWEDVMGVLWIGTNGGGLNRFDRAQERFTRFLHDPDDPESLSHDAVRSIVGGSGKRAGVLWIGTRGGGLNRFDTQTERFTQFRHDPSRVDSLGSDNIKCLALTKNGRIWIGTVDAGLNRMSLSEPGKFTRLSNKPGNPFGLSENFVKALYCDKEDAIWLGSADGLKRMGPNPKDRFEAIPRPGAVPFGHVQTIKQAQDGAYWIGTNDEGLFRYDRAAGDIANWKHDPGDPNTLAQDYVLYLDQDSMGNLWVAGFGSGLSFMAPNSFNHFRGGAADEAVNALLVDRGGELWLGTENSGLLLGRRKGSQSQKKTQEEQIVSRIKSILSLLEDRWGGFWIGTRKDGLYRFDRATQRLTNYQADPEKPAGSLNGGVKALFVDPNGVLWAGTTGGLSRMEPEQPGVFSIYRHDPGDARSLSDSSITCLHGDLFDGGKPLWIGTYYGGLNRMELAHPGAFVSYRYASGNPTGLNSNTVYVIHEDETGTLWLGTSKGLNRFDPESGKARHFVMQEGLASNLIYAILGDERGKLWISTPKGLSCFDRVAEVFRGFSRDAGLVVEDYKARCGFRDASGRLYFGGKAGVTDFFPKEIMVDPRPPQMAITSFLLDRKPVQLRRFDPKSPLVRPIEETSSIDLSYTNKDLELRFAAMHYSAPKSNRHKFMLEGYDNDWVETHVDDRRAVYTNLDPGTYTFRVKGSNKDGTWSEETHLKISIPPPPWKTGWALTLYGLALVGLLVFYVRQQQRKLEREHQKLEAESRLLENERHVTERLRQVDALKDEFLANTSHELRTPLHGMVGLAESLIDGVSGELPESARGNLAMIVSSGRRLGNLVNDILDFAKLEKKSLDLRFRAVDLYSLAEPVLAMLNPLAQTKNLLLNNEVPKNLPLVRADEDRLQQVLHNLLGNAIKFTQEGSVTVSAELQETRVLVSVTDTGQGIAEADLERIFQSFEQVDAGVNRAQGGTGLGLTICKQLIELHDSQIQASSSPGKGSRFSFVLLLAGEEEPAQGTRLTTRFEQPDDLQTAVLEPGENEGSGYRILVVDDDPINRQVLYNHLVLLNHQITEAADGAEALAALENEEFDLVLLDIMMPRISGYEVCSKIRERLGPHELPIIFLSARNRVPDLTEGFASGANDYLTKPVARQELLSRLNLHLHLRDSMRLLAALNEEQRALDEVVRKVNREMGLEGLLSTMLDLATRHIAGAEGGTLFLWYEEQQYFKVVASSGYDRAEVEGVTFSREFLVARYLGDVNPAEEVSTDLVRRHNEPVPLGPKGQLPLVRCMLSMPLHLEGELEGFLVLDNFSDSSAFDTADVRMLDRFREHAVSALAKARFLRALQDHHETLVRTQEQLLMQDKMASLGTLTSGIGHEINNPTNFVNAGAQNMAGQLEKFKLFLFELAGDDAEAEILDTLSSQMAPLFTQIETIMDGTQRIAGIVRDLSTFALRDGGEDLAVCPVDLGDCLRSTLNLVRPNFFEHVNFIEEYVDHLIVPGRQASLNQVFMNLIVNACQAIVVSSRQDGVKGRLTIRTLREGEWGRVVFEDTGGGIPTAIRKRIFEPFFTTKGAGGGTGLGLSITYGIVERHGGRLEFDSVEGQGTTFSLSLPYQSQGSSRDERPS